jgi:serine/threonine-protein phosphatase 6 regulatory subunit 3
MVCFQDLFFKYTWNNFLHSQVEQCIAFALNSELSLFADNGTSENVLLRNVSMLYTSEIYNFLLC